jgi:hypothetical protein
MVLRYSTKIKNGLLPFQLTSQERGAGFTARPLFFIAPDISTDIKYWEFIFVFRGYK